MMTPITLPSPAGPCFAAYHPAAGAAVLFIPMFGYEALATHRVWARFADRLAQAGTAVLRLDLPGTGDSAGEVDQPDPVAAWQGAVDAAVAWLAARHGAVTLLGCRFGALLALDAAGRGVPCRALVLLDPPNDGAGLVRQLKARARLKSAGGGEGDGAVQAYGIPLGGDMLAGFAALPATGPARPDVLLIQDPPAATPRWLTALREAGAAVDTMEFPEREAFVMRDSFRLEPPARAFDRIAAFLADRPAASVAAAPLGRPALELPGLVETPVTFGPGLFGILTQPPSPARVAALIPSVGNLPRSGPQRMMADLARRLARDGIASLRYDCECVGDSAGEASGDTAVETYVPAQVRHVSMALDELGRHGIDRAVVVGHCSGAYLGWHAAAQDPRIAGVFAANLQIFQAMDRDTASSTVRPGGEGPGPAPEGPKPPPKGLLARAKRLVQDAMPRPVWNWLRSMSPGEAAVRRHLRRVVGRGCRVRLVYGDVEDERYRLHRAFNEPPRLPRGADVVVVAGADHMFSAQRHRARLLDLAAEFVAMHDGGMERRG